MKRIRRGDVYSSLRSALLAESLAPGERLPSSRSAAVDYGVSRGMIDEVYAQLVDEGFLERSVGRGTFVSQSLAQLVPARTRRAAGASAPPSRRGTIIAANAACREPEEPRPFNAGIADTSHFPWKMWHRLYSRASRDLGIDALAFADPRGLPALRAAIARYLTQFRGLRCDAGQVIIFSSAQQALYALAVLLVEPRDRVLMEDPGYLGARAAFQLAGAEIAPVAVDGAGMIVSEGIRRAARARLAYVTPPHQYPTGVALSLERRLALIDWAASRNAWVIEDDYDGEFRYDRQPLTPLHALDTHDRVVYIGTLNKSMFVSLRLAYAVVPEALLEPLANIRTQLDGFTPPVVQLAMSHFMEEGHFPSHLRHMRSVYAAKRDQLIGDLAPLSSDGWSWSGNSAGMHLMLRHRDGARVRRIAAASSLDLACMSAYRVGSGRDDGLFLRFGGLDRDELHKGAVVLVEEIAKQSASKRTI